MKITKKNITNYLIDLQLKIAGYQITYDEIEEQNEVKQHLNPNWRWFDDYTITFEQQNQWYKEANPVIRKLFHCNKTRAEKMLQWLNLDCGLTLKI